MVLVGVDRGFAWRISAFFGALFVVYGVSLPYLPVLLDLRGLTAAEIGIVSSMPLLVRLFLTPAIAVEADRRGDHRSVIIWLACAGLAAISALTIARGFWPLLLLTTAFLVAIQSIMPLIETIAMSSVKRHGHDYGRMRLWGSASFIIVTFAGAALIDRYGAGIVVGLLAAGAAMTVVTALALPVSHRQPTDGLSRGRLDLTAAKALIASKPILLFMLAAGSVQSAHAVFYAFGVLHWRSTGVAGTWIGVLWSIGVAAEIALFWWSKQVMARVSAVNLLTIGAAAAVLRWTAMALDPPLAALVPLQALHGLTYGATHLGAMHFIQARVADGQAGTAQALYSTVSAGIGMGIAMMFAGYAYQRYGGASYLGMAALAMIGVAAALALGRISPRVPE